MLSMTKLTFISVNELWKIYEIMCRSDVESWSEWRWLDVPGGSQEFSQLPKRLVKKKPSFIKTKTSTSNVNQKLVCSPSLILVNEVRGLH